MIVALIAGAAGLGVSVLGYLASPNDFFRAYLVAYCFVLGLSMGSMGLLMLQHMVGGQWGLVLRRPLEAASSPLVLAGLAVLFLPLLLGLPILYPWADPAAVAADSHGILKARQIYMNVPLFIARFGVYFLIWIVMAICFRWWSLREDKATDSRTVKSLGESVRYLAAPGLVIYSLSMTFASIDWGMSVNKYWYSTMYPVLFAFGAMLSSLVFVLPVLILLKPRSRLGTLANHNTLSDIASLLLAFTLMWAYLAFSQFLLIWSANLRVEVTYYTGRLGEALARDQEYFNAHTFGGFGWVGALLVIGHFFIPFMLLLVRKIRHSPNWLFGIAIWMLVMRFIDYHWTISPSLTQGEMRPSMVWLDVAAAVGLLGLLVALFLWQLQRQPVVPEHDPRVVEAEAHHG